MDSLRLDGKVVIVTGAAGGIGETARRIAGAGPGGRGGPRRPGPSAWRRRSSAEHVAARSCRLDVESTAWRGGARDLRRHRRPREQRPSSAASATSLCSPATDYYRKVIDINLHGVLRCVRACYPSMRERGGGAIVNQSSTAAWMPGGAYGLTKLGVNGLTRDLAVELGPMNIRINAIAPGPIDTPALREGVPAAAIDGIVARMCLPRRGEPADLVGTCLFLLSDASGWMTGQILTVDGGHTFRV
jgi:NAD(P)-dependent dehydrogenase (short-subunit alcohol dehydrogenase family)